MKLSKISQSIGALVLTFSAVVSQAQPGPEVFSAVFNQAQQLGYTGYDVMVCLDETNRVVIGGVSFWHSPLQIYIANIDGTVIPTTGSNEKQSFGDFYFVTAGGQDVLLSLGQNNNDPSVISGVLSYPPQELVQLLTCYRQYSGLE